MVRARAGVVNAPFLRISHEIERIFDAPERNHLYLYFRR